MRCSFRSGPAAPTSPEGSWYSKVTDLQALAPPLLLNWQMGTQGGAGQGGAATRPPCSCRGCAGHLASLGWPVKPHMLGPCQAQWTPLTEVLAEPQGSLAGSTH